MKKADGHLYNNAIKTKNFVFSLLVVMLAFGSALVSCDTGNDTVSREDWYLNFAILGDGVLSPLSLPSILARIEFTSITFSNGSAVISASTGRLEIAEH